MTSTPLSEEERRELDRLTSSAEYMYSDLALERYNELLVREKLHREEAQ